jgi:hypothetical protein
MQEYVEQLPVIDSLANSRRQERDWPNETNCDRNNGSLGNKDFWRCSAQAMGKLISQEISPL